MDRFETCVRLRPTSLGYGLNTGVGWIMESKSTLRLMISGKKWTVVSLTNTEHPGREAGWDMKTMTMSLILDF